MLNEKALEEFFNKLKEDSDFAQNVFNTSEAESVQMLANEAGIDLTLEDVMASKSLIFQALDSMNEGELNESDLDQVAGGLAITTTVVVGGAVAGLVAAIAGGTLTGGWALFDSVRKNNGWKW